MILFHVATMCLAVLKLTEVWGISWWLVATPSILIIVLQVSIAIYITIMRLKIDALMKRRK